MKCCQLKLSFIAVVMTLLITTAAGAVEISIIGATSATITEGGAFTIDLGLDNASLDNTPGFEAVLSGLAAAGADVTGGAAAQTYLNQFCFAGSGCFNGLPVSDSGFWSPHDFTLNFYPGEDRLVAIRAGGATFSANDGSVDLGVANDIANATPSAIDSTIHLIATVVGVHELTVGGSWSDGVDWFALAPSTFTLTVLPIPEPGTALLLGLGLTGLTTSGRRKNEGQ